LKSRTRTLIKLDAVLARFPVSRPTLDRMEAQGKFPKRVHVGRLAFWDANEIESYLKSVSAEQRVS
jgi:predicted DNA-binding transcriptional regulator AlpA